MAVRIRSISMDLGPHCIYLCLKNGLETGFAFKWKRFRQVSKFFEPERKKIIIHIFGSQWSIELRRLLD